MATIAPRFTLLGFHVQSFSVGLLNGKLISLDLLNAGSSSMALSDEPRLIWEALCTDIVLKGDIPGSDLCLLLKHLRHVQEPVLAISAANPRFLILCLLCWTHEVSRLNGQTCVRKIIFWSCGIHPASTRIPSTEAHQGHAISGGLFDSKQSHDIASLALIYQNRRCFEYTSLHLVIPTVQAWLDWSHES